MKLLQVNRLEAFYGDFQALFGIDFNLDPGETVAIIGSNGAGKSTFMSSLTGLLTSKPEQIVLNDCAIGHLPANDIVAMGIALVPEGRRLFKSLSVEENLLIGATCNRAGPWSLDRVYTLFPVLSERRHKPSTDLSGGQQQMVAIGRALMSNPEILLCDELSLGLAPVVVKEIYDLLPEVKLEGTSIVIVEQDIGQAMAVSDRVYCFQEGCVSLTGAPSEFTREQISTAYFGV